MRYEAVWKLTFVIAAMLLATSTVAQEDPLRDLGDPVARVQEQWQSIPDEDRAELVLIPALAAMDAPPANLPYLLVPGDTGWDEIDAWISAPPQQAAFEALETVGVFDSKFVFALGYGTEYTHADLAQTTLAPTLTNGEFLAGMEFKYLQAMKDLDSAVTFEALKRASEGDGKGALDLHASMLRTLRLIADRPMYQEVEWSFQSMLSTLERMRDVLYLYPGNISPTELKALIKELDNRELRIDRVRFPMGDKLAYQQLVRDLFVRLGRPDPTRFGPVMAQLAAGENSLQLFGEAGWWVGAISQHGDYYRTSDAIDDVFGDWEFRWGLHPLDWYHHNESDFDRLDPAANAMLLAKLQDGHALLNLRILFRVELAGTRLAFGSMAYRQQSGDFPDPLFAIRPEFVREIDIDPFDSDETAAFRYFVPMRDQQRGAREAPTPHQIEVATKGEFGDQRGQIFDAVHMPKLNAVMNTFTTEQIQSLLKDLTNHFEANSRSSDTSTTALSEASSLYAALVASAAEIGVTIPNDATISLEETIAAALSALPKHDDFIAVGKVVESRSNLTSADLKKVFEAFFGLLKKDIEARILELSATSRIAISLGRDTFLLYSVGFDSTDELARIVGHNGTDYLIWPPIISLVRAHGGLSPTE